MGCDTFVDFGKWRNTEEIIDLSTLIVINRPGYDAPIKSKFPHKAIDMPALAIASSDIRKRVKAKKSIAYLTPDSVVDYIHKKKLYVN